MFADLTRLRRGFPSGFTLDHDVKVDELVGKGRHVVLKAKCIFPDGVRGEDIVALSLGNTVKEDLFVWIFDVEGDIEGASALHLDSRPLMLDVYVDACHAYGLKSTTKTYSKIELDESQYQKSSTRGRNCETHADLFPSFIHVRVEA